MAETLKINEIFFSIQGESTRAGEPCVFVRLTGCHLRCGYCDTEYAFYEGRMWSVHEVLAEVEKIGRGCRLVEVTGGEPLLQPAVHPLMTRLCDVGHTVLLETSGACDIAPCDRRVVRIMDLKTPGSGQVERNLWSNIEQLTRRDEVKFVLCDRGDYDWMKSVLTEHNLPQRVAAVLVSAVHDVPQGRELPGSAGLSLRDLSQWVLADGLPVRVQVQLHKLIWDPQARGV
ncbi:MAG: radical SAM protein [Phycisphaeraceae bacterium]|nr:radical SAM protein [Phycisphaeraceae bacterium]